MLLSTLLTRLRNKLLVRNPYFGLGLLLTVLVGASGPTVAESAIEEIVVTALKRETALTETPLAITALSGNVLDAIGARDFNLYFRQVPGLTAIDSGAGRKRYILRGVNNLGSGQSQATVAQYLDEVPITNNFDQQPDPYLIDIERVEVLRGPQGTLFGARSMAGTVRTITRKPRLNQQEGRFSATASTTRFGAGNASAEGVFNAPVSDGAALRLAAYYSFENGYIDNVFPGGRFVANPAQLPPGVPVPPPITLAPITQENFSDVKTYGGRAAWRWLASDRLTVDIMALVQKSSITGVPFYNVGSTGDEANGLITAIVGETGNDDELWVASTTAAYDLEIAELTAIASYAKRDNFVLSAANAAGALFSGGPGSTRNFGSNTRSWTFEGRLTSTHDGPWQWIAGAYAFTQNSSGRSREFVAFGGVTVQESLFKNLTDELSAFGELSYSPVEHLTLTTGIRYSDYRNRLERNFIVPPPGGIIRPGPDPNPPRFNEGSTTLKFSADFEVSEDMLIYATASQGFRPGGFNGNAAPGFINIPVEFASDSLWNYEVGAKASALDQRLNASGALYRIDWTDMQVESFIRAPLGPGIIAFTTNASSARITGFEFESRAQVTDTVSVSLTFNHFFKAALTEDGPVSPIGLAPKAGDRLPYNSKTSFTLGGEVRTDLTDALEGFVRLDISYTGGRTTGFRPQLDNGQPNNAYNRFADYGLMNARVGVSSGPWRLTASIDNLTDARPVLQQLNFAPLPVTTRVTQKPRTIGLNLSTAL
ncbi:MAG: TonB-dependent receptor [Rhodospirillaceae bacterium]|nr:TonB-dependent receptor [Rhodospirillaceae bacterium]